MSSDTCFSILLSYTQTKGIQVLLCEPVPISNTHQTTETEKNAAHIQDRTHTEVADMGPALMSEAVEQA
jgi:hypothetical protein